MKFNPVPTIILAICTVFICAVFASDIAPQFKSAYRNAKGYFESHQTCHREHHSTEGKLVILRLDDVRSDIWSDISIRMITDALKLKAWPVLGVIPNNITQDPYLYGYLVRHHCNPEIALHGYTHEKDGDYDQPEFAELDYNTAHSRLTTGMELISGLTRGNPLVTFIPPQNTYSSQTRDAVRDLGFQIISGDSGNSIFDLDTATKLYESQDEGLVSPTDILAECERAITRKPFCIVTTHPQDFATNNKLDEAKYQNFLELIALLRDNDYHFVTFKDVLDSNIASAAFLR